MLSEGIQKFFKDLGVDPMELLALQISKYMEAVNMGEYTLKEFE
jgi:hypothetical protein